MESLFGLFDKRKISLSLQNFGVQDIFTLWELKSIIENKDIFSDFYSLFPLVEIDTLEDYYLYLLSLKFDEMREIAVNIKHEEDKLLVIQLADSARKAHMAINKGKVIKYINEHIQDIFDPKEQEKDIWYVTLEIIPNYINGIKTNTLEFLAKNYYYLLIDRYDKYEKVFEKNLKLFETMFSHDDNELYSIHFKDILNIWGHIIKKEKSNLKEIVNDLTAKTAERIKTLNLNITDENIFEIERITNEFYNYLDSIKDKRANEFSKLSKSTKNLLNKKILKEGQRIEYNMPMHEGLRLWKEGETWEKRLISITHSVSSPDGITVSINSRLSFEKEKKQTILDSIITSNNTDDYFTHSHQQRLCIIETVGTSFLHAIISDKNSLNEYLKCVMTAAMYISKKLNIEENQLKNDITLLAELLKNISINMKNADISIIGLCYGASMYACALSEKLLRILYYHLAENDIYIPNNKITLGYLLNVNNHYIVSIFGENHIKHLSYFLQRSTNIGCNYRNMLAHWYDLETDNMTPIFVARTLWLFTDILNTIFAYYIESILNQD